MAAQRARGPGSFAIEIVDAIYNLDRKTLTANARIR
jgi:hydroxyethylthiazole kinase-like sugar kinase family protein